jgi:hypothetical protein
MAGVGSLLTNGALLPLLLGGGIEKENIHPFKP